MRSALGLAAVLVSASAFAFPFGGETVKGNGKIVEQTREVEAFDEVQITRGMHAEIRTGSERSVRITGDENVLAVIRTRVEDGELIIDTEDNTQIRPTEKIRIRITAPRLEGVAGSGGSEVRVDRLEGSDVDLAASGGSEVRVGSVSTRELEIAASGGSEIEIGSGTADTLDMALSGGSECRASSVTLADVEVAASGGSQAQIQASRSITGALSGGSIIEVHGRRPERKTINSSGGSRVTFREG